MGWKVSDREVAQLTREKERAYGEGKTHMHLRLLRQPGERYQWHYDGCGKQKACERCGHSAPLRAVSVECETTSGSAMAETLRVCQACDADLKGSS